MCQIQRFYFVPNLVLNRKVIIWTEPPLRLTSISTQVRFGIWVSTQGGDNICDHLGPRPWGHHHTSSAHPPRCLTRCEWKFPRSFITTRRSASHALERFWAVHIAVSEPFLSRSWAENGGKLGFWAAIRPFLPLHDLKPVPAITRQKRVEGAVKAPCRGSSPIAVVVWR
jgi:hypothetical protein